MRNIVVKIKNSNVHAYVTLTNTGIENLFLQLSGSIALENNSRVRRKRRKRERLTNWREITQA
jgi:hypothetical protein